MAAEIIRLEAHSSTEEERQRFEAFVRRGCRRDEAESFLSRSFGGDYVLSTTRAGWAAWQAAIADIIRRAYNAKSENPQ